MNVLPFSKIFSRLSRSNTRANVHPKVQSVMSSFQRTRLFFSVHYFYHYICVEILRDYLEALRKACVVVQSFLSTRRHIQVYHYDLHSTTKNPKMATQICAVCTYRQYQTYSQVHLAEEEFFETIEALYETYRLLDLLASRKAV